MLSSFAGLVFLVTVPASVSLRGPLTVTLDVPTTGARTGSLSVKLTRADRGTPVSSGTVRVFWETGRRYFLAGAASTDAKGEANIPDLPLGAAWVLAEAPGLARASTALVLGSTRRELALRLGAATEVHVRVETDGGAPVRDATVLVDAADALPFGALTDTNGHATLSHLTSGAFRLRVYARGFDPATRASVTGDQNVVLHAASGLDVAVTDASGHAAPSATVLIAGSSLWPARSAATDATGHAKITGLAAGVYDLKAERGSLVSKTEVGFRFEHGEAHPLTLVLAPGRMIPIIATDGEGDHPLVVPDADVVVVEGGVGSFPVEGRTNRFGKVTLGPFAPGALVAAARADGFVERSAIAVPEPVTDDVRIALYRGATLAGVVTDGDGRPVDGASVEIVGTDLDGMPIAETPEDVEFRRAHFDAALGAPSALAPGGELGVTEGPIPPIPQGALDPNLAMSRVMLAPDAPAPWVTNTDGSFRATPIPPGRVRALIRHPSYVEALSDAVTLATGGQATIKIVLHEGGALEGTVVDDAGLPVSGAGLEVAAVFGSLVRSTVAASDGTFALATLPRDVLISVARPEDLSKPIVRRRITVPEGSRSEIELVLPAPRGELELTVSDASGQPVKMAQVTALSLDPDQLLRTTAFTGDDGRAVIRDAVGLPLRVLVEAPAFAEWTQELEHAPEKLSVDLSSGVSIEGRVTAVRGRRDVDGATVELFADGHRRVALTDANGEYRFSDLTPGKIHLTVTHPEFATAELDVEVTATGRVDRPFDVDPIDLAEPGSIDGHVVDKSGEPVSGARVGVGAVNAYLPVGAPPDGTATTQGDGAFHLSRVRPGTFTVEAYAANVGRGRTTHVVVESDQPTQGVVIRLSQSDESEPTTTGGVAVSLGESGGAVVIQEVAPGSEAEHAGLVAGDVVDSVDRAPPRSLADARERLSGPAGSDVVVGVVRSGAHLSLRVARERVRR